MKWLLAALLTFLVTLPAYKKESKTLCYSNNQRKIRFTLYTEKDLSDDRENILFSVFIKEASNKTLWDSGFTVMKVNDIPAKTNKIVVEKAVPNDNPCLLEAGFSYTVENATSLWHIDTSSVEQELKIVEFNFE